MSASAGATHLSRGTETKTRRAPGGTLVALTTSRAKPCAPLGFAAFERPMTTDFGNFCEYSSSAAAGRTKGAGKSNSSTAVRRSLRPLAARIRSICGTSPATLEVSYFATNSTFAGFALTCRPSESVMSYLKFSTSRRPHSPIQSLSSIASRPRNFTIQPVMTLKMFSILMLFSPFPSTTIKNLLVSSLYSFTTPMSPFRSFAPFRFNSATCLSFQSFSKSNSGNSSSSSSSAPASPVFAFLAGGPSADSAP
mmetsp:Transcript_50416/g.94168  ORF Transcript_50416/g.94168 Transcript_50416/m.94168 type:complete len:252 (-) Transcript_50416:93-848(-)